LSAPPGTRETSGHRLAGIGILVAKPHRIVGRRDRGAPVSPWAVAKEMGHGGRDLVDRVYGHLGEVRHRTDVVEYRANQHQEFIKVRLEGAKTEGQEVP